RIAFGNPVNTIVDYHHTRVILSLDSDFLQTEPGSIRANKLFARGRRVTSVADPPNRLYVVEPSYSTTGSVADHRLRMPARDVERYAFALAAEIAKSLDVGSELKAKISAAAGSLKADGIPEKWVRVVASELTKSRGRSAIVVGSRQPARLHAL